ncbi:MAG: hypothetical protein QXO70_05035, partial [Candidatus Pacearchaeota archaeon]
FIPQVKELLRRWYPKNKDFDSFFDSLTINDRGRLEIDNLDLSSCGLTSLYLPKLFERILRLNVGSNGNLKTLPDLPDSLEELGISNTQVDLKDVILPRNLRILLASNTPTTSLPQLPDSLEGLHIDNTQVNLKDVILPKKLRILWASNTPTTSLPQLPDSLEGLHIDNTQVNLKDVILPKKLRILWAHNTPTTSLPDLPDSLEELDCRGCPLTEEEKEKIRKHRNYNSSSFKF